ncbi:MAG: vitamin K epoxide reductase family protein, partial [Candidatus Micrarchaeaceae archaeon]
ADLHGRQQPSCTGVPKSEANRRSVTMQYKAAAQIALSALGLAISAYLAVSHYTSSSVFCPSGGIVDCEKVLNSTYSLLFGVPLAVYGVLFFLVDLFLILSRKQNLAMYWNGIGMGFVIYFLYLEYLIGKICIYCTAVHIIVIFLLALSMV